jgi:hypothetical protein
METDFPAAHSMDTFWFAVDRDGHVGYFDTGEGGAVPAGALIEDPYEVWRQLTALLPRCEISHDLQGHLSPGPRQEETRHRQASRGSDRGVLMFLRSLDPVQQEIAEGTAKPLAATAGAAVLFAQLGDAVNRRLHSDGHCLGCFPHGHLEDLIAPTGPVGLYFYCYPVFYIGDRSQDAVAGPYRRRIVPRQPVHVDQLAPSLREVVTHTRFRELCFAETVHIQPCEMGPVECENSAYLTLDGRTIRPIEDNGFENSALGDYREFYDWLLGEKQDWLAGIHIEPPAAEDAEE